MNNSRYDGNEISSIEKRIENGTVFELSSKIQVANNGGIGKWLFKTGDKPVVILQRQITTNGTELDYQVISEATVTASGTPITNITNRNASRAQKPTATAFSNPTATGGTGLPSVYMPGADAQGQRTIGQFDGDGLTRVLEPNKSYIAQVTNNGTVNNANVELYLLYAELIDPTPQV